MSEPDVCATYMYGTYTVGDIVLHRLPGKEQWTVARVVRLGVTSGGGAYGEPRVRVVIQFHNGETTFTSGHDLQVAGEDVLAHRLEHAIKMAAEATAEAQQDVDAAAAMLREYREMVGAAAVAGEG